MTVIPRKRYDALHKQRSDEQAAASRQRATDVAEIGRLEARVAFLEAEVRALHAERGRPGEPALEPPPPDAATVAAAELDRRVAAAVVDPEELAFGRLQAWAYFYIRTGDPSAANRLMDGVDPLPESWPPDTSPDQYFRAEFSAAPAPGSAPEPVRTAMHEMLERMGAGTH